MKLMLKYAKPFTLVILVCFALLYGQTMADLALPNYMSDIVNVGIQQGGVNDAIPKAISENGLKLIGFFASEDGKAALDASYRPVEAGSTEAADVLDEYPKVGEESMYLLEPADDAARADAEAAFGRAAMAFVLYMKDMAAENPDSGLTADTQSGFGDVDMAQLYQMLPMLSMLPPGTFDSAIQEAADTDSLYLSQVSVSFTKLFYRELGADMDKIQKDYIYDTGKKMLLISLLGVLATIAVGFLSAWMSASIGRKMRHDIFTKVSGFSNAEIDRFSTASLITRTTNDVTQVQMLIVMGIRMLCSAPIMGIGGIVMAVRKSASLSWIIAVAVLVLFGLILIVFAVAMPKFKILQKLIDRLNLVSRENLSGLMVIRAFGNEDYEEKRFARANDDLAGTQLFVQRTMALMMPIMMLIMNLITLTIIWVGAHAIADSKLLIGDMMAFMQYAMQIIMSFLMIAMMFIMVPRAMVSASRISEVLSAEEKILDKPQTKKLGNVKGLIEFKNVSFRYGSADDDVLRNISFTARPGQTTAIIGPTGSGKSTLLNLIPRFYDVTEGAVTIDGVDIRDAAQQELRDKIGYIPQKGVLFSGDIKSNIRYGRETADVAEIETAIEVAQAKEFVDAADNGLDTSISQDGTNVSGGQKQRLSIARALIKKPPIYLFDDSFSALDFKTDAALRRALRSHTGDSTVLIVAQRVSTIMHADQILVLEEGRIVGMGTHQQLMETCKEYREIAESQFAGARGQEVTA